MRATVFSIQDDIAKSIASRLQIALRFSASLPVVKPPTSNMEAYDLYLKGRYLIAQRGKDMLKGLEFMDRAIQLDGEFSIAYAASAEALTLLVVYGVLRPREVMPKAKAAAEKVLDLDSELAEVRNAVALIRVFYDWDWEAAEAEFSRTLDLALDSSPAHYWFGLLYHQFVRLDSERALQHAHRALELDPLATLPAYALGMVQVAMGRYEDAVATSEAVLTRDPASFLLRRVKGVACTCLTRHDEAIAEFTKGTDLLHRDALLVAELGAAYVAAGRPEEGRKCQTELETRHADGWISPTILAITPSALGDLDHSAGFLKEAFEERDPFLIGIRSWPPLKNICRTERARAVVRKMGLEVRGD